LEITLFSDLRKLVYTYIQLMSSATISDTKVFFVIVITTLIMFELLLILRTALDDIELTGN
jgi:hypothetical protein